MFWPCIDSLHVLSYHHADLFSATGLACKPKRLLNLLKPVAASYQALGVQLGVSLDKIKEFEAESSGQDVRRYLREVLERWLGNDPQLDLLVDALTEIGHKRLADTLETAYDGRFPEKPICVYVYLQFRPYQVAWSSVL